VLVLIELRIHDVATSSPARAPKFDDPFWSHNHEVKIPARPMGRELLGELLGFLGLALRHRLTQKRLADQQLLTKPGG
jgi:hypothetical protein